MGLGLLIDIHVEKDLVKQVKRKPFHHHQHVTLNVAKPRDGKTLPLHHLKNRPLSSFPPQASTVRSTWTTATRSPTPSPRSPSASTKGSVWTGWGGTTASAPWATWGSAARGTSTSACPTRVTRGGRTAASSSPTTTGVTVAPDTRVRGPEVRGQRSYSVFTCAPPAHVLMGLNRRVNIGPLSFYFMRLIQINCVVFLVLLMACKQHLQIQMLL